MTRRRWIADEVSENRAALTGEHANHLQRVLRARVGQEFDIVAGSIVRRGRILGLHDGRVELELGEEVQAASSANLTLVLAVFKFDRMEWAIEKCTELGVRKIIPVITRRTDAHLASASEKRVERWRRIALQASEQSRRTAPPEIPAPPQLNEAIKIQGLIRVVLSEAEREVQLRDLLTTRDDAGEVILAIGPEGGWAEDELELFRKEGWVFATLGPTILRAETAAIAAAAVALSELGG